MQKGNDQFLVKSMLRDTKNNNGANYNKRYEISFSCKRRNKMKYIRRGLTHNRWLPVYNHFTNQNHCEKPDINELLSMLMIIVMTLSSNAISKLTIYNVLMLSHYCRRLFPAFPIWMLSDCGGCMFSVMAERWMRCN